MALPRIIAGAPLFERDVGHIGIRTNRRDGPRDGRLRISRLFFGVIGRDVVDPDISWTIDLYGHNELLGPFGYLYDPLIALPVVRDRRVAILLRPNVGDPLVRLVPVSSDELNVEDRFRRLFGLHERTQLQPRCRTEALHFLKPLGDRGNSACGFPQVQAGPAVMGDVSIPEIFDSREFCPLLPGVR